MADSDPGVSALPLYHRLALRLESEIHTGAVALDGGIDNELDLAARFGVSRPTMRRAILHLVDKGLLVRKRGVGTYVVPPAPRTSSLDTRITRDQRLSGLFDDLTELGRRPRTVVLTGEWIRPPQSVVEALDLPPGRQAVHLRRLRCVGPHPLAILENYLPIDIFDLETFDASAAGLYQHLRSQGISLRIARQRVGARNGTPEECALLDDPTDSPLLTVERTTYDDTGRIVEVASHLYRAGRHEYAMTLVGR